jgi:glyoxylase-like metal-dependent hydrolase (beta-lactamase superfamily II)
MTRYRVLSLLVAAVVTFAGHAAAQEFDAVAIETVAVGEGVWMLKGRGGNIGVSAGVDGVLLIDDQYAPLTTKIRAAVGQISDQPIRFVLNTHWHGDHTGGNENLGQAGALIVAHENVRARMSVEQFMEVFDRTVPASSGEALPVVTFTDTVTFHVNDEDIRTFHVSSAHTDGDSIIHFPRANVLHVGDVFFNGMYPFIDVGSGGSVDGLIAAVERALALADGETKIIPGHGPLSGRQELVAYRDMLVAIRDRIAPMVAAGHSLEEIQAAEPTASFDEQWGGGWIEPAGFVSFIYDSLTK